MRNITDNIRRGIQNTHFVFSNFFFGSEGKYCTAGQATYDNMAHAYYLLGTFGYKYTQRILIAFPLQQCLHERVSVLRYMYIALLVT